MTSNNDLKVFSIILKLNNQYQKNDPSLVARYKKLFTKTGSFRGGRNIDLKFITCEDNIFILLILQS